MLGNAGAHGLDLWGNAAGHRLSGPSGDTGGICLLKTSAQSMSGALTKVTWDAEEFNFGGYFEKDLTNNRFTVLKSCDILVGWMSGSVDYGGVNYYLYKNGVEEDSGSLGSFPGEKAWVIRLDGLVAGDYIEAYIDPQLTNSIPAPSGDPVRTRFFAMVATA